MKSMKAFLLLLAVLVLGACTEVSIEAPVDQFVDDEKPALFKLSFSNGIPPDLEIQLNTAVVTHLFDVTETGAVATGAQLDAYIDSGRNILRVTGGRRVRQVTFFYDTEGPAIHILDADRSTGWVTGYAEDPGGVVSISLDGIPVALDPDHGFRTAFAEQSFHSLVATDGFGHTRTTDFAGSDVEFSGISARLNQGGLDFLVEAVEDVLRDTDFTEILDGIAPVTLAPLPGVSVTIRLTQFDLDQPDLDLVIQDDETIDTHIEIHDFDMGIFVSGHILLLPWATGGTVHLDRLTIDTQYLMDIRDSDLEISLSGTRLDQEGLRINLSIIPMYTYFDQLLSYMVESMLDLFEPLIVHTTEQVIVPIVSDFVKDIPIDLQLVTPGEGEIINIHALPEFLDSAQRGITVDLATHVWAPEPASGVPGALGSLFVEGDTPSLGAVTPAGEPFDFGASISSNVINQALLAAHESGVTTVEIHPDTYPNATPEGIAVYNPASSEIRDGDAIGMRITPAGPPFVRFMTDDGAAGMLGWVDTTLTFDLYKPAWGEYRTLFGVTFDLEVPFEVNATEDGFLSIGIEQLPTIHVTDTDDKGLIPLPAHFINATLDYFLPVVMPRLAERLKLVPLPRIYNHSLFLRDFWVAGPGDNSLSLAGDLVPIEETAAAPEPTTWVEPIPRDVTVYYESVSETGVVQSTAVRVANGEVTVGLDGVNPEPELGALEYRYRIDGGGWSVWKHREAVRLRRLLAGSHRVEVCARTSRLKHEQECPVVSFETRVAE